MRCFREPQPRMQRLRGLCRTYALAGTTHQDFGRAIGEVDPAQACRHFTGPNLSGAPRAPATLQALRFLAVQQQSEVVIPSWPVLRAYCRKVYKSSKMNNVAVGRKFQISPSTAYAYFFSWSRDPSGEFALRVLESQLLMTPTDYGQILSYLKVHAVDDAKSMSWGSSAQQRQFLADAVRLEGEALGVNQVATDHRFVPNWLDVILRGSLIEEESGIQL